MKKEHIFIIALIVLVAGIVVLAMFTSKQAKIDKSPELTTALGSVAKSLTDSGAKFYGASWCPHCADQKSLFKSTIKQVPYIECSTGGAGSPQTQVCVDAKIQSYPTWEFAGGVRASLVFTPFDLAYVNGYELNDADRSQLQSQKDAYMAVLDEKEKQAYTKSIEDLKIKLTPVKK